MNKSGDGIVRRSERLWRWCKKSGDRRQQRGRVEDVGHDAPVTVVTTVTLFNLLKAQIRANTFSPTTMARRDRSYSPETSNKRVRQSHRSSPRSPSPTRRSAQRSSNNRSRYNDDRDKDRDRDRDRERPRDRYRDDRRREPYRDGPRDDRRRSRSRERRPSPPRFQPPDQPTPTPQPEDEKMKAKRAKLEAWKKEREAKKALGEAKAKAMALAGKSAPGESLSIIFSSSRFHIT